MRALLASATSCGPKEVVRLRFEQPTRTAWTLSKTEGGVSRKGFQEQHVTPRRRLTILLPRCAGSTRGCACFHRVLSNDQLGRPARCCGRRI